MTNLYDGQLTDIIINESRYNPEIQALAYALLIEKHRIMEAADRARTLAMIEQLPEAILDVLAVELRSPYYTESMTIEQKRDVIAKTLVWYYHAGTPAAITEMTSVIFGSGQVVEWFNFDPNDGEIVPGEFDMEIDAPMQDPMEYMEQINRIINRVKNTRSHLRSVRFLRFVHTPENPVTLPQHYAVNPVRNVIDEEKENITSLSSATFAQAAPMAVIRNIINESSEIEVGSTFATFAQAYHSATIPNVISGESEIESDLLLAAFAQATPTVTILSTIG